MERRRLLPLFALLLGACGGFVHDETLAGPWRLVAVDRQEDMMLCRSIEGGGCAGDGLPGPRIIAAGADERHVVVIRRAPSSDARTGGSADEYYYLIRTSDEATRGGSLHGPFDVAQFAAEKARLGLPEFSRVFLPPA